MTGSANFAIVIASEAKQSSFSSAERKLDRFVASAPRNDGVDGPDGISVPDW
jgi:hypothetical protein